MNITISTEDQRSIRAIEIAAGAGQWIKCRTRDGRKAYGVPSQCHPLTYYLADCRSCTCVDFQRRQQPCKHVLGVRLFLTLARAQQSRPSRRGDRRHLAVVPAAGDIFGRFESD